MDVAVDRKRIDLEYILSKKEIFFKHYCTGGSFELPNCIHVPLDGIMPHHLKT